MRNVEASNTAYPSAMPADTPANNRSAPLWRTVSLLGVSQIVSWGTLYYTLTVLAAPIRQEPGFSDLMIFGAFTLGQLASGLAAPWVGRRIDSNRALCSAPWRARASSPGHWLPLRSPPA